MLLRLTLTFLLFCFTLVIVNVVHFRYFPVNVVLYCALLDVLIALVLAGIVSWYGIFRREVPKIIFAQLMVICALAGYIAAISLPTVIDRSYSMYILEKLQQQGGGLKQEAFAKALTEQFMQEHRLGDARLTEQLESGTIHIEDGCVKLTPRGQAIAATTRWYRRHLLPQKRLLMGEYTDALTDPFREPTNTMEQFKCGEPVPLR